MYIIKKMKIRGDMVHISLKHRNVFKIIVLKSGTP